MATITGVHTNESLPFTRAWLGCKDKTVEGHTKQCILLFNGKEIWGPAGCHNNTSQIAEALEKADDRFRLLILDKQKTVEGHTRWISIQRGHTLYLDKLSTHENMAGLCQAVYDAQVDDLNSDSKQASRSQQDYTYINAPFWRWGSRDGEYYTLP